jgi:dTDP-4-dehydrorhamnose 3,5-epimerase
LNVKELGLKGVKLIQPRVFTDSRGFFFESYHEPRYEEFGIKCRFVQDNHSYSKQGTIRGMHFQKHPGQDKLIRVVHGKIFDVFVDIRPESPTYCHWEGVYLDAEEHRQLFIPIGFAHGFCVVSHEAHVLYKVSSVYNPETECGFRWDDPTVGINWPISGPCISERDSSAKFLKDLCL